MWLPFLHPRHSPPTAWRSRLGRRWGPRRRPGPRHCTLGPAGPAGCPCSPGQSCTPPGSLSAAGGAGWPAAAGERLLGALGTGANPAAAPCTAAHRHREGGTPCARGRGHATAAVGVFIVAGLVAARWGMEGCGVGCRSMGVWVPEGRGRPAAALHTRARLQPRTTRRPRSLAGSGGVPGVAHVGGDRKGGCAVGRRKRRRRQRLRGAGSSRAACSACDMRQCSSLPLRRLQIT